MIEAIKPKFYYGYVVVSASFILVMVVEGLILYSFGIFYAALLADFGWTRGLTSGAFSLGTIIRLPLIIYVGRLVDKFGPRRLLTVCGLLLGLGYILMSQINTVLHLYLVYGVIIAIGMSLYWIPIMATIPRWFTNRIGVMMGIITSGIGVGQIVFPPLVSQLISLYGWRASFVIVGWISLVLILIAAQFMRRAPKQMGNSFQGDNEAVAARANEEARQFSIRKIIRTKQFWMFGLIYFFWILPLSIVIVHIVVHAIDLGMDSSSAAKIITIIGITTIMGRLFFGRMADKVGNKKTLILSLVLMTVGFLWLLVADQNWMIYLFPVVFGLSYGVFEMLQSPLAATIFGTRSLGTILGVFGVFSILGMMIGPILAGYIFDMTGNYNIAFIVSALSCIAAAVCAVFLKEHPLKLE